MYKNNIRIQLLQTIIKMKKFLNIDVKFIINVILLK